MAVNIPLDHPQDQAKSRFEPKHDQNMDFRESQTVIFAGIQSSMIVPARAHRTPRGVY